MESSFEVRCEHGTYEVVHCKKQSVRTTLIGVIYDTVGVLITLIVGWLALYSVIYYTTFYSVYITYICIGYT